MTKETFHTIYKEYWYRLYQYALKFVGREDAEDAVSDAFIGLWKRQEVTEDVKYFLCVSVKNGCINILIKQRREIVMLPDTEDNLIEIKEAVLKAIKKMHDVPRRVLQLTMDGYSNAEISKIMGKPDKTIRNRKWEGIEQLKTYFKNTPIWKSH